MNIEKIRSKKALKFLGLLISAMVIAAVSAQVYNYMYATGEGKVTTGTGLKWVLGADAPGTTTIVGNTVSDINMTVNEGNPRNYTDCLRIQNQDATAHTFSIEISSSPSSAANKANFTEFNLVLFNGIGGGTQQAVLDVKTQGSSETGLSIPASTTWGILFELVPVSSPTTGAAVEFEVTLIYES
jgi:hypothetical protein